MVTLNARVGEVTERIVQRSRDTRQRYLDQIRSYGQRSPRRAHLSCGYLAHGFAACGAGDKEALGGQAKANIAIVSSYNDMLSAHQPFERFPAIIKEAVRQAGAVAQFAGGVPAMCDGVTQGLAGMELSLFSRDVIALATAVALSHDMFDGALYLGICDKIVPGLAMAALSFGHLPAIFVPGGPMTTGLPNNEKSRIRQPAEGKVGCRNCWRPRRYLSRVWHPHATAPPTPPDGDGDHGLAPAGRQLRQPQHAAARRPDGLCRPPRGRDLGARQRVHPHRRGGRRARRGQRRGRPQRHRRLDQPHHAPRRHGAGRRHQADLGRFPLSAGAAVSRIYPNGSADVNLHAAGGTSFLVGGS